MTIKLRGHHLLCLLGYRGMGYSEQYVENMTRVYNELLTNPATECLIVSGPDQLCACFPPDGDYHCENRSVALRDQLILERLGLELGQTVTWADIMHRVKVAIHPDDLLHLCATCQWLPYGVCQEGVRKIAAGEPLLRVQ